MSDLLALADRVEKLTGPDRRVDAAICRIIDLPKCEYPDCLPIVMGRILDRVEAGGDDPEVPAYTSSLDAAMSLVPEGWGWGVGDVHGPNETSEGIGMAWAEIWARGERTVRIGSMGWDGIGRNHLNAATPALALSAAALRALANRSAT